jgi:hypothetical protein
MSSVPQVTPKKAYQKPSLKIYGNIGRLTAVVDVNSSQLDGGGSGMNKTH